MMFTEPAANGRVDVATSEQQELSAMAWRAALAEDEVRRLRVRVRKKNQALGAVLELAHQSELRADRYTPTCCKESAAQKAAVIERDVLRTVARQLRAAIRNAYIDEY